MDTSIYQELNIFKSLIMFEFKEFKTDLVNGQKAMEGMYFYIDQFLDDPSGERMILLRPVNNNSDPFLDEVYVEVWENDAQHVLQYTGQMMDPNV